MWRPSWSLSRRSNTCCHSGWARSPKNSRSERHGTLPLRGASRPLAHFTTLIAGPRLPRNRLQVEPTKDIERLCSGRRAQPERRVASARTAQRFPTLNGGCTGAWLRIAGFERRNERHLPFHFSSTGHEGWFSLIFAHRGHRDQIRAARVNDVVWPFEHMAFTDVIPAMAEAARDRADLLSIRGRVGLAASPDGVLQGSGGERCWRREGMFWAGTPRRPDRGRGGLPLRRPILIRARQREAGPEEGLC